MSKKFIFSVFIGSLLALVLSGFAFAAENPPGEGDTAPRGHGGRAGIGQVVNIGDGFLTLNTPDHGEKTVLINERTRFRTREGAAGLGDVQIDQWVAAVVVLNADWEPVARLIVLLPEDFDPNSVPSVRVIGEVTAVDPEGGSLSIHTRQGEDLTFAVTDKTKFKGQIEVLKDVEVGMMVGVLGREGEDGKLVAIAVLAGNLHPNRPRRAGGVVTTVQPDAGTFSIRTRKGEELTFLVDENTQYRSENGELNGLEDLQPDMIAIVVFHPQEDGSRLAAIVGAGRKIPKVDLRIGGRITELGASFFSIENPEHGKFTFEVSDDTLFLGRNGSLKSFEDLEVGTAVGVGAVELDGGGYQAAIVIIRKAAPQPEK